MAINVSRPVCKEGIEINSKNIGKDIKFSECGRAFRVPAAVENDNTPNLASAQRAEHQTSVAVTQIVSAIEWITCVVAVIIVVTALTSAGRMGALALAPAWGILIGGLILVVAGQTSRAVLYTESIARQILQEIRRTDDKSQVSEGSAASDQMPRRNADPTGTHALSDQDLSLFEAVQAGDLKRVEQLLADGANTQARDGAGYTPAGHARGRGYNEIHGLLESA